ncbi:MAG: TRAP transporter large permease [Desulfofustis sp.]|jgi:tripartite ATP-independent transporter DctM subunit|nr:TRAP transporter large permease [Desulfofustis sp.]
MSPSIIGVIGILLMLAIFITRMPVAYVMTLVGLGGFCYLISAKAGLSLLPRVFFDTFSSYELTTIPLFVLMGQLAFNSGISRRLYSTTYTFLGSTRGGLAMATVSACTAFGAVCGSSPATAATMATVGMPEMKRFNYSNELAAGSVASGGGLGMIMPPSVVLIVYGILTEQSIGALFVSGIIPALLLTVLFIISIYVTCRINPEKGPKGERFTWRQKIRSLAGLVDTVLIFVLVMAGLFAGFFTPTESAAVGVLAVLVVSLLRRQLTWKAFVKSLHETLQTSVMILFLVAGAMMFGKFLAVTRIPFDLATWISGFDLPPLVIISIIVLIYFFGGCFMDSLGLIMLTIPIFFPIIVNLGYDPIWFGVIIVLVTEMGVITPPVGLNVYVVYGVARNIMDDITLESIFRGIVPFLIAVVAGIVILMIFPQIVLYLPNLMY